MELSDGEISVIIENIDENFGENIIENYDEWLKENVMAMSDITEGDTTGDESFVPQDQVSISPTYLHSTFMLVDPER